MSPKHAIKPAASATAASTLPPAHEPFALKALAAGGFFLLALAVCVRPMFKELSAIAVPELLAPPPSGGCPTPP
jgi:hypothetical protein